MVAKLAKSKFITLLAAAVVSTATMSPVTASADGRGFDGNGDGPGWDRGHNAQVYRHWQRGQNRHWNKRHRPRVEYRHRGNNAAAAAILGIAGAAIIGGALAATPRVQREYYVVPQNPYPPQPAYRPRVTTYQSFEPWTRGWYEWCDANYRSFNPQKGTFRGYDGLDHFCVPK